MAEDEGSNAVATMERPVPASGHDPMDEKTPPHMDVSSRNIRLMDHLISLGLFVEPALKGPTSEVEHLRASVSFPIHVG